MKHWNYEHIENYKHIDDYTNVYHGYQQWLDFNDKLWYRGNFVMDEETGYHDQFLESREGRHIPAIVIYYIK